VNQVTDRLTYYVRRSGSDSNNGLSVSSAFHSLQKALLVASSGATIYVGGGTYTEEVQLLGAKLPGLPLRIVADTSGSRTGEGGTVEFAGASFRVVGSNHVILEGFVFRGGNSFPLVWEDSYDGQISNCRFLGGAKALLMKDGSLTLDQCDFSGFQQDAIVVDGEAQLKVNGCQISGSSQHGIHVRKNALVTINGSTIQNNNGSGIQVEFTDDEVEVGALSVPACQCAGTSPKALQQEAYNLLGTVNPQYTGYRQLITAARDRLNQTLAASSWTDEWHAKIASGPQIYDLSKQAVEQLQAVYTDDIDFVINGDVVDVKKPYEMEVAILGAAIKSGNTSLPVTVRIKVGRKTYEPWGAFGSPTGANVNDGRNPRIYQCPETFQQSESFSLSARSWSKLSGYNGSQDRHWEELLTVASDSQSGNLKVLRNGDEVPNLAGYGGQAAAETYLAPYIDPSGKIKLADNQVIFLFELGTTNLRSSAADFQDLVALVSLRKAIGNTTITAREATLVRQAMDLITQADRSLAECAINEATCSGGKAADLAAAQTAFQQGVALESGHQVVEAVTSFGTAWQKAKSSTGNVDLNLGNRLAADLLPAPPAGWKTITAPELRVSGSTLTGNGISVVVDAAQTVTLEDSSFSHNREWGVALSGSISLRNCVINNNAAGGIWLTDVNSRELSVRNLTLADNGEYALYADGCELNFDSSNFDDWHISGSQYVIAAAGSNLSFGKITISGGTAAGVLSSEGIVEANGTRFSGCGYGLGADDSQLTLQNCTFSDNDHGLHADHCSQIAIGDCTLANNGVGLYLDQNGAVHVAHTTIRDHASWGAVIHAGSTSQASNTFDTCTIHGNSGGISLRNATDGDLVLTNTVIRNNANEGLRLEDCNLTLANADASGWQLLDNGYGVVGQDSTLVFDHFTSNSNTCGAMLTGCDARVAHSTFSGSSVGLSVVNSTAFAATNSHFTGNQIMGVSLTGPGAFHDCTIANNSYGIAFMGGTVTDSALTRTRIADNSAAGIYLYSGALSLTSQASENWAITGNATNILSHQSTLSLAGATLSGSSSYGVYAQDSQVHVAESRIDAAHGHGIYGYGNQSLTVQRSFINIAAGGWGVLNHAGPLEVHNSVINGAASGVYSHASGHVAHIRNSTVASTAANGIHIESGEATIQNTILVGSGSGRGLSVGNSTNVIHTHNLVHGFATNFVNTEPHETELIENPRFVDETHGDFRLAKGSPAINSGVDVSDTIASDLEGNQRPAFKAFDIGAYEFTSSAGSFRVLDWRERQ